MNKTYNSLLLWLPDTVTDISEQLDMLEIINNCNGEIEPLLNGEIELDTYLDLLDSNDIPMDNYLQNAIESIEIWL
jgi:hypothetical protein